MAIWYAIVSIMRRYVKTCKHILFCVSGALFVSYIAATGLINNIISLPAFAQNTGVFQITQLLQNESDPSIVAFKVYGTFRENDVVNIYANGVFIKAKPINTPDLAGIKEITVENISVDVFQRGVNKIVAKIERDGSEKEETPPFQLTIQEPPSKPSVTILISENEDMIAVDVTGDLEEGDSVSLFLNELHIRARTVTHEEATTGVVHITGILTNTLRVGENVFEANILRGKYKSDKSEKSNPIIIEELIKEEPKEEVVEKIGTVQCVKYDDPKEITHTDGKVHDGFGTIVDVKDNVFVADTEKEASHIHIKGIEGWLHPVKVFEKDIGTTGSANKSVAVYDSTTVLISNSNSRYRERSGGAVYVYRYSGGYWFKQETIAPSDLQPYERFGSSIALDSKTLIVSALRSNSSGSIYVYTRANGSWGNPSRIIPRDTRADQDFGRSISVSGNHIAVGAPGDGNGKSGAVYVYTQSSVGWTAEKITQENRRLNARFGTSVLIDGNTLLVGAIRDEQGDFDLDSNVVYVYEWQGDNWRLMQKLKPNKGDRRGKFGTEIAYSDDKNLLAIGAEESNKVSPKGGAVYVYRRVEENTSLWLLMKIIAPDEISKSDRFGSAIDFDGLDLFVGAYGRDGNKKNTGAVYLYNAQVVPCPGKMAEEDDQMPVMDSTITVSETPQGLLKSLKKKREVVERLATNAASLAERLKNAIQNVYDDIANKDYENIIIYDESMVHEQAQKRAALRRGIIGPGLPEKVVVRSIESPDEIPKEPTEETVRTRNAVVRETESKLGVVIPITTKDLQLGDIHEEIYRLQVFLNEHGYIVAREGAGSPGKETSTFTQSTNRALKSFQLVNGLPITGMLDKKTRDVILTFVSK